MAPKLVPPILLVTSVLLLTTAVHAVEYGGIEFPGGTISFADQVVTYDPSFGGGNVPTHANFTDPDEALGVPNYSGGSSGTGSVSLGSGGQIVLRFIDNILTGSNSDAFDLHIFEVGPDVEDTYVDISVDGVTWAPVGKVFGSTSSIDIDFFGFGSADHFSYVRLTDDPLEGGTTGSTVGADIDAVGAITTVPRTVPDSGASVSLLGIALLLVCGRRRARRTS